MKEKYLHYLWQNKLLPFHQMSLVSGERFTVIYAGDYNETESGPDFFNAQILIDGILWNGNVEIHVRSSDWFRHGHQNDPTYNNVILHVVHTFDKEIILEKRALPTLELKNVVSADHYEGYTNFFKRKNPILCASQIANLDRIHLVNMQDQAIFRRLHRKTEFLNEFMGEPTEALYLLIAKAMGSKVNQLPFEELARRVPYRMIRKVKQENRQHLLLQVSGLSFPEKPSELLLTSNTIFTNIEHQGSMNPHTWKYGGVRPGAFPDVRIRQFAEMVDRLDPDLFLELARRMNVREYFHQHFSQLNSLKGKHPKVKAMTVGFMDLLLINAIVPFLWWFGQLRNEDNVQELACQLLSEIPAEQNNVISKWERSGVKVKNALESQAMLEIFNEFCFRKKCLSCGIGKTLLER